jgi:hypothetical protein
MLLSKIKAECNFILSDGGERYMKTIQSVNEHFLSLTAPKTLDGTNKDVVVQYQLQFEELCVAVMANGIPDPKGMTFFRFYAALKYFDSKKNNKTQPK